jgi:hypothetical protein
MWKVALGIAILFNAGGVSWADPRGPVEGPPAATSPVPPDEDLPPPGELPTPADTAPALPSTEPLRSTQTRLLFRNDVGDKYQLVEVRFVMDGEELPTTLSGVQRGKSYVMYEGPARPGRHIVSAHLTYQGRSRGMFTYTKGYRFKVTSDQVLTMPADKSVAFTVVGKETKGLRAPVAGRLAVTVEETAGPAR